MDDVFGTGLPGTTRVRSGKGFAVGEIATLPVAEAPRRGEERRVEGASGVADRRLWLRKNGGNIYEWADIPTIIGDAKGVRPVYNVKDYGAKGDGTTDDTTTVRAAITAAESAGGGIVYFPPGTYPNAGLAPGSNITFLGAGPGLSIIKLRNDDGGTVISLDPDQHDIALLHLTIDGNRDNQIAVGGAGHGIRLWGTLRLLMYNVEIKNTWAYGIGTGYSADHRPVRYALLDHLYIHDGGHLTGDTGFGDGMDLKRMSDSTVSNVVIADIHNVGIDARTNRNCFENIWIFRTGADAASNAGIGIGIGRQLEGEEVPDDQRRGWALVNNLYIQDVGQGNGIADAIRLAADTIDLDYDCRVEMNNVHIHNPAGHGIQWVNDDPGDGIYQISNLHITGAGENGLNLGTSVDGDAQEHRGIRINVANGTIKDCVGDGVHADIGSIGEGIHLTDVDILNNGGYGIYANVPRNNIVGGTISGNADGDIFFDEKSFDSQVIGGRSEQIVAARVGINVRANRVSISGWQASGAGKGIEIVATADGTLISGASLIRCDTPVTNSGTNTTLATVPGVTAITPARGPLFSPEVLLHDKYDAWFRFDKLGLADGTAVSAVEDWGGTTFSLVQATGTKQPLYKTAIQNGLDVLRFDGTDDELLCGTIFGAHPFLIAFVAKENGAGYYLGSTQARVRTFGGSDFDAGMLTGPGAAVRYSPSGGLNPRAWHVHVVAFNGASSFGSLDGARISSLNPGTAGTSLAGNLAVGSLGSGSGFMSVDFGEILALSYLPPDADIYRIEGYLAWKWGLEANLPGAHAYVAAEPW